jgi:hypothetical protein
MDELVTSICFVPMFNSYGLLDVILTGDGKDSRIFRNSGDVKRALQQAGITVAGLEEDIDGLNSGVICEISVSGSQRDRFYAPTEDNLVSWKGPVQ